MGILDKLKSLVGGNADKVEEGIDKVADAAKDHVGEEHADKIDTAAEKAKDVVGDLAEEGGDGGDGGDDA